MREILITSGEPTGIGPDVTIQALLELLPAANNVHINVFGDEALLKQRANLLGCESAWQTLIKSPSVTIIHTPLNHFCTPGKLDIKHVPYVLAMLDAAIAHCLNNPSCALVTAPVQKSIIAQAGIKFSGHTEYLAHKSGKQRVVMMLAGPQLLSPNQPILRVALATTHLPLSRVAQTLSEQGLLETLQILHHALQTHFGISAPRILVTGLNPHAGEAGLLGREEIEIISPAIAKAYQQGINARGPLPADTLFQPYYLEQADCVLAMYHDQGLTPLKYATFGHGVNVTLGLPFMRTSVDHGTALELAGTGKANYTSMVNAIQMALDCV